MSLLCTVAILVAGTLITSAIINEVAYGQGVFANSTQSNGASSISVNNATVGEGPAGTNVDIDDENLSNEFNSNSSDDQTPGCNCVMFRIDDIADFDDAEASLEVMDLFLSKNQSLNLALVMSNLGSNREIVDKLADGHKKGLFELAAHTWGPGPFNGTGYDAQKNRMTMIAEKMEYIFGRSMNVFVPPYAPFDNDTLQVMKDYGLKVISTAEGVDNKFPIYVANGSDLKDTYGIYHLPATARFVDHSKDPERKVPVSEVLQSIDNSIAKYGWAVVVLHPQDFKNISDDGKQTKEINGSALDDLATIIDNVTAAGQKITTFSETLEIDLPQLSDQLPPRLEVPADIATIIPADSTGLQQINLGEPNITDLVDPYPDLKNDAPSVGFPVGKTTAVTWTATDSSGHNATAKQYVTLSYTRDERPPQISVIAPARDQEFKGLGADKEVTVQVTGIASDKDSAISEIAVRTVFGKKYTPFVSATPLKEYAAPSLPDWSEWKANITFGLPGRYEIIAKATDYFGNEKVIALPVIVDFENGNLTETRLILDPPSSPVLGGPVIITGRLVHMNTTSNSEIGISGQVITFDGSHAIFPDVVTEKEGRFSSSGTLPASSGLTFVDLDVRAYFPGDGTSYAPSSSEIAVKYRCGSMVQLSLCTPS
jgi:peptidoglycan/xylan/chitin deacetylase (PgdA/CDA1 family)